MKKLHYTHIPDTSDSNYWLAGKFDSRDRTQRFRPKDKELHQMLRQKEWDKIQARLPKLKNGHV